MSGLDKLEFTQEEDRAWAEKFGNSVPDPKADMVNHPPHYTQGGIECIDALEAALTPEEFRGYCKAAAMKYIWRELHKGGNESLQKAIWYLNRVVE